MRWQRSFMKAALLPGREGTGDFCFHFAARLLHDDFLARYIQRSESGQVS